MALLTASVAKEYIPELSGTSADAVINSMISRVESQIARWLGFPKNDAGSYTLDSSTYTLYLDGPLFGWPDILALPVRPVSAVTSVHSDVNRVYGSDTLIDATTYTLDAELGRVIFIPDKATTNFDKGYRAIKVVCTAGHSTVSPPADLVHAIGYQTALYFRNRSNIGRDSVSSQGSSIKMRRMMLELEVRQILFPYRNEGVLL